MRIHVYDVYGGPPAEDEVSDGVYDVKDDEVIDFLVKCGRIVLSRENDYPAVRDEADLYVTTFNDYD